MVSLMASDCLLPQVNITSARLFYMGALIIGYFVIFNLFIAILLDSFGGDGEGEGGEGGEGGAARLPCIRSPQPLRHQQPQHWLQV